MKGDLNKTITANEAQKVLGEFGMPVSVEEANKIVDFLHLVTKEINKSEEISIKNDETK